MKINAAGIFIVNKDGEVLIGHITRQGDKAWSIPKGKIDDGETAIQGALRETLEESNIDLRGYKKIHALPRQTYNNKKKDLQAFVLFEAENAFDFSSFDIKCTSMVPSEKGDFPEIDDFKWVSLDEVDGLIHMTQVASVPTIKQKLNQVNNVRSTD